MRKIRSLLFTAGIAAVLAIGVGASVATTGRDAIRADAANITATIQGSDFSSYSSKSHSVTDSVGNIIDISSVDVMKSSSNPPKIQLKKNSGEFTVAKNGTLFITNISFTSDRSTIDLSTFNSNGDLVKTINNTQTFNASFDANSVYSFKISNTGGNVVYLDPITINYSKVEIPQGPKVSKFELEKNTVFDSGYETELGKTIVLPKAIVTGDEGLTEEQKKYTVSIDENNQYATFDSTTNTITLNGNVDKESKGTITVTYKTNHIDANGNNLTITKTINLYKSTYTGVAIDPLTDDYYFVDEELQLHADVTGKVGTPTYEITWEALNPEIATIDSTGKVTVLTKGSASFKATAGEFSDTVTVDFVKKDVDSVLVSQGNPKDTSSFTRNNMYTSNSTSGFKKNTGYIRTKNAIDKKVNKVEVNVSAVKGDVADIKYFDLYRSTSSYNDGTKIASFIKNKNDVKANSILTAYVNEPEKNCYYTLKANIDSAASYTSYVFAIDNIKFYEANDPLERIEAELISTNVGTFKQGDSISKDQFKVTAYRKSGDFYELNESEYEITNETLIYNQSITPVNFSYTEYTVTKTSSVNVDVKMADHLDITYDWKECNYYEGDDWDLSKITVNLVYGTDVKELVSNPNIKITDLDGNELTKVPSKAQDIKINVAFTKFDKSFDTNVTVKSTEYSVTALIEPTLVATAGKVDYKFGEAFDLSGYTFEYTDAYGVTTDVTTSVKTSIEDKVILKQLGTIEFTATYKEITSNKITVNVTNVGAITEPSSSNVTYDMGLTKDNRFNSSNSIYTNDNITWTISSTSSSSGWEGGNTAAFRFGSSSSAATNTTIVSDGFATSPISRIVVPCKFTGTVGNGKISAKIGATEIGTAQNVPATIEDVVFENTDPALKGEITITFTQTQSKQFFIRSFKVDHVKMVPPTFTAQEQAKAYADYFAKTLGTSNMCHADGNTPEENLTNIKNVWVTLASEYDALGKDAKDLFKIGSNDAAISNAISFYSFVLNRYQTKLSLNNFMVDSAGNLVVTPQESNIADMANYEVITIFVATAILSITAIAIFAISKHKRATR